MRKKIWGKFSCLLCKKANLLIGFVWLFVSRKWKETVDEWVKLNQPGEQTSSALMGTILILLKNVVSFFIFFSFGKKIKELNSET